MSQPRVLRMRRELSGPVEPPRWPRGVSLRTLGQKPDKSLVQAAHAVLEAGYWEGGGGAPVFRQWWKSVRRDKEYDPALVFLAMEGGEVVGLAQCWTSNFVKDLAVHPRARKRGIGRALMLSVFDTFAHRGAAHADLKVREENAAAISLYHGLGMRIVDREKA